MGNNNGKDQINDEIEKKMKESRLSENNAKTQTYKIPTTNRKQNAIDCHRIKPTHANNDAVLICIADNNGDMEIIQLNINSTKTGKIKFNHVPKQIIKTRCALIFGCSISPSLKYIAFAGFNNIIGIFMDHSNNFSEYQSLKELWGMTGCVYAVKYISDNLILSGSGDTFVTLWNIEHGTRLIEFNCAEAEIFDVDYIHLYNNHIVTFASVDGKVYIQDISNAIKHQNNDKNTDNNQILAVLNDTTIGQFKYDVNAVSFSPNGQYLAATGDDGSYKIFAQELKQNIGSKSMVLEWNLLCKKRFDMGIKDGSAVGTSLCWIDNGILIVGCDKGNVLYCTSIIKQKDNDAIIQCVSDGVERIYNKCFPNIDWSGFSSLIANEIMQFLHDHDHITHDFQYVIGKTDVKVSCLSSCQYGDNIKQRLFMMSAWDGYVRIILLKNI
eukprot:438716_1